MNSGLKNRGSDKPTQVQHRRKSDRNSIVLGTFDPKRELIPIGKDYIHFNMFNALGKQDVTLTVSVVYEIKPAHLVLDELIDWLSKTKNHEVLEKIEALQEDMSFMDESDAPVVSTRNDTEFHYTRTGNVHTISIERP